MSCCGCDEQPNEKNDESPGPTKPEERGCTDMFCCLLIFLYWGGMIAVFGLALALGNPYSVLYGKDYGGFRCGLPGAGVPNANLSKVYFPRISADLVEQADLADTPWKLHLYGICVAKCPLRGEYVTDYGCPRPALYPLASRGGACSSGGGKWLVALDTVDIANRCMPMKRLEANSTLLCSAPSCLEARKPCYTAQYAEKKFWLLNPNDPSSRSACVTEVRVGTQLEYNMAGSGPAQAKLEESLQGMNQMASSIMQSQLSIFVFGVAAPVLLGFVFIALMRFAAGPIVYAGIALLFLVLLAATLLCSFRAGLFGQELVDLLMQHGNSSQYVRSASGAVSGAYASAQARYDATGLDPYLSAAAGGVQQYAGATGMPAMDSGEVYKLATLALIGLDFGYVLFMCMSAHQLAIAVEIIEEGSTVIATQPTSLLYPFVTIAALIVLFVYFMVAGVFIGTLSNDALEVAMGNLTEAVDFTRGLTMSHVATVSTLKKVLGVFHVFGFLWTANFMLAGSTMVIAGSVSCWFFYRNDSDNYPLSPVLASLYNVVRYHLGTIAFGSLVLALAQALRLVLEYVNKQTEQAQESNLLLKMAMSCLRCCMWCFEKCIKYVSGYAYIYVALNGDSFCSACKATFTLFLNYPAQVAVNAFVQTLLRILQCVAVPMTCSIACYYYAQEVDGSPNPVLPSVFALVLAYSVCRVFSGVYETTVDTIFVCAMRDKEKFEGRHTPKDLARVLGL